MTDSSVFNGLVEPLERDNLLRRVRGLGTLCSILIEEFEMHLDAHPEGGQEQVRAHLLPILARNNDTVSTSIAQLMQLREDQENDNG